MRDCFAKEHLIIPALVACLAASAVFAGDSATAEAAANSATPAAAQPAPLAAALGVSFVEGSASTLIVEREGKKYLVDVSARTITEVSPNTPSAQPASPAPAPPQNLQPRAASAQPAPKKEEKSGVYEPGDDYVFTLPSGRRLARHGFYVNFNHRFAFDPAFSGAARGATLFGLDGFALPSLGFRYGVTDKLSVGIYRSPTFLARPIELGAAYNFADERDGLPLNAAFRFSVDGQNNFAKNFTFNFEGIFSRSITSRAQIYLVPTVSLNNRRLFFPTNIRGSAIPDLPGYNSFALGVAGALDIRPTVALIAEVNPTLVGGRALGIHRPAYAFGIQKKIWRHAFTFGFTNSPGTTTAQRSGTNAAYLNDPSADTPSGLFIGFDLTRQVY
ncbi:MAG: DUF5777 family beta-barrel protein [Terriglobia bacterium]